MLKCVTSQLCRYGDYLCMFYPVGTAEPWSRGNPSATSGGAREGTQGTPAASEGPGEEGGLLREGQATGGDPAPEEDVGGGKGMSYETYVLLYFL